MELVVEFVKLLVPAALVLYAMYLTVNSFLNKDLEKKVLEIRNKNADVVLPIRLQAYERVCLFLERITPNNIINRLNDPAFNSRQFQHVLLTEIREEFLHNLSQQVYMSDEAWNVTKNAMEEVVVVINQAAAALPPDSKGLELARKILEIYLDKKVDPISYALTTVKDEIRKVF
jgi:hypothetical protein